MSMAEFQNRTLICSVLFIDIVEYSRKPVVKQSQIKDRFNAELSGALRGVAISDRIILDTGDGAAISFIGDPEDALFVATGLRDSTTAGNQAGGPELPMRMGINLGPVRLVKDINKQPNIIGDGINVAQRVMTFARPGQVLVSPNFMPPEQAAGKHRELTPASDVYSLGALLYHYAATKGIDSASTASSAAPPTCISQKSAVVR